MVTRNISGMLFCCTKEQSHLGLGNYDYMYVSLNGFVACLCVLIFAMIGQNTINIPEITSSVFRGFFCLTVRLHMLVTRQGSAQLLLF